MNTTFALALAVTLLLPGDVSADTRQGLPDWVRARNIRITAREVSRDGRVKVVQYSEGDRCGGWLRNGVFVIREGRIQAISGETDRLPYAYRLHLSHDGKWLLKTQRQASDHVFAWLYHWEADGFREVRIGGKRFDEAAWEWGIARYGKRGADAVEAFPESSEFETPEWSGDRAVCLRFTLRGTNRAGKQLLYRMMFDTRSVTFQQGFERC